MQAERSVARPSPPCPVDQVEQPIGRGVGGSVPANHARIAEREQRHCGQNQRLPDVPVRVRSARYDLVDAPRFTVSERAVVPAGRRRLVDGDVRLVPGATPLATPGHAPGHRSLPVETPVGWTLIVWQHCHTCAGFRGGTPIAVDMDHDGFVAVGRDSVRRLRALGPGTARFSNDRISCAAREAS